jgi:phage terminase small subunit
MKTALDAPTSSPGVPAARRGSCDARQQMFAEHWIIYRNATQAYKHAYNPNASYEVARNRGTEVFNLPGVQAEIEALQIEARQQSPAVASVGWLLRRLVDIGTADPRELIGLKVGCCRYCHGEAHGYQWREREYWEAVEQAERDARKAPPSLRDQVMLPDIAGGFGFNATHPPVDDCPQCHGEGVERFVPRDTDRLSDQALLLYGGVKVKRDGYEIVLADQGKALELAGRIMGAFNDKLDVSHKVKGLLAVADLAKMDPQEASRKYQDFIRGKLAVNAGDPRTTGERAGHGVGFIEG